jgi:hypothetical protein
MIQAIEDLLGTHQVAILEGAPGAGKSTLVAQFAERHADATATLYISTASRYAYDPEVLLSELVSQLHFLVRRDVLAADEEVTEALLRKLYLEANRRSGLRGPAYIIIDGLSDIPPEQSAIRDTVMNWMPFGLSAFKIILSGSEMHECLETRQVSFKEFPLPRFSMRECEEALGAPVSSAQLKEIFEITKGHPEFVAAVARQLRPGRDIDQLLADLPTTLPKLFLLEWSKVDQAGPITRLATAVLAFSDSGHTTTDLSVFLGCDATALGSALSDLTFLRSVGSPDPVTFASASFRRFAQEQLAELRPEVERLLVDALLRQPDSPTSLLWLPTYLARGGNATELLSYLSGDRLAAMLERSQLRAPAKEKAMLGLDAALKVHRDADALRLGLVASQIAGFTSYASSRSEIEARMAIGEHETALALANSALLRQDRLRLLAAIARKQKESGVAPQADLVEQISELVRTCDQVGPEDAADLAADLFYVRPELALRVLDSGTEASSSSSGHGRDWTIAKVTVEAAAAGLADVNTLERLRTQIRDPEVSRLTSAVWLLMRNYTADQALAEVDRVPSDSDKLYLLRQWAQHVDGRSDPSTAMKRGLDLCIRSPDYTPNATHLRELATPIHLVESHERAKDLIGGFDTLSQTAREVGPTEDYVRLQLALAGREAKFDFKACSDRLFETYFFTLAAADVSVRAPCFAHFAAALPSIDPLADLENSDQLHTLARDGLESDITSLLSNTAEHWLATRRIISALAKDCFEDACRIASRLNVQPRRDQALLHAFREALGQRTTKIALPHLLRHLSSFSDSAFSAVAIREVLERYARVRNDSALLAAIDNLRPFIHLAFKIEQPAYRVSALTQAVAVLARTRHTDTEALYGAASSALSESWNTLDDTAHKVDTAFGVVTSVADKDRAVAHDYLSRANDLRGAIGGPEAFSALEYSLRLAIRAFSGLTSAKIGSAADLSAMSDRIRPVPSNWSRSVLMSDLALVLYRDGFREFGDSLVERDIRPALAYLEHTDAGAFWRAMSTSLPALYVFHHSTAFDWARKLPLPWRDKSLDAVLAHILDKSGPRDPFDAPNHVFRLKYEDAIDALEVLSHMEADTLIYSGIQSIARSAAAKVNRRNFTKDQRSDLAKRASALAQSKLPNASFISHEGFLLASLAEVYRLGRPSKKEWDSLIARARALPNRADVLFVFAIIAEACTDSAQRSDILTEAIGLVDQLPSPYDRASRYEVLAQAAYTNERPLARSCIEKAMQSAARTDADDSGALRRSIVDSAYALDPKWAEAIIDSFDEDEARAAARSEAEDRLSYLKIKRRIADSDSAEDTFAGDPRRVAEASWGVLAGLNAGRVGAVSAKERRPIIRTACSLSLPESYPMFALTVESCKRVMVGSKDISGLRSLWDSTIQSCDFAARLWRSNAARVSREVVRATERGTTSEVVHAGDRAGAIESLTSFLKRQSPTVLKIADPYLGPDEIVELLTLVRDSGVRPEVFLVTSRRHFVDTKVEQPWDDAIRAAWKRASDQDPPQTTVVIAGLGPGGESPIHERWWLTDREGLRVGTSFGSLGLRRESEWSVMSDAECSTRRLEYDEYLFRRRRIQAGETVSYVTYDL